MSFLQPWPPDGRSPGRPADHHPPDQPAAISDDRWAAMMFLIAANRMSRGYAKLRQWLILDGPGARLPGPDLRGQPAP